MDSSRVSGSGWTQPEGKVPMRAPSLGPSHRTPPCSPRPAGTRSRKPTPRQLCVPGLDPAPGSSGETEAPDLADEEVSHINSAAPPGPGPGGGFLDLPGRPAEPHWASAELEGEAGPTAELATGTRRKKKMSPPCISVEPPAEDDGATRPPGAEGSCTTLRRRTPSCEPAPHRDTLEPAEGERRAPAPGRPEHLAVPCFAYDTLDTEGPGGDLVLHGSHGTRPDPSTPAPGTSDSLVPSRGSPERGQDTHLGLPQSSPHRAGPPLGTPTSEDTIVDPL